MISHTEENYLKALFSIASLKGEATVNEVSKQLSIKMPTVNSMMKRLAEKELVHYESYKPLKLTDKGTKRAALIIRKHRLTEMYLVEKMGFGWEEVHNIAEQIEHIQSPELFERMDKLLGYPKFDPHGSPIPDAEGNIVPDHFRKLADCREGDELILKAVQNSSHELLTFLNQRELHLGIHLRIDKTESFDQSMEISCDGKKQVLSAQVTDLLLVERRN